MSMRSAAVLTLATGIVALMGCAFGEVHWSDPLKRQYSLERAQDRYTELVRWSEFKKASAFLDPELRDAWLADMPSLRKLRFTDYETGAVDIDDETGEATVLVTYFAYAPSSPIETEIVETQKWYRASVSNDWRVRPSFEGLDRLAMRPDGG